MPGQRCNGPSGLLARSQPHLMSIFHEAIAPSHPTIVPRRDREQNMEQSPAFPAEVDRTHSNLRTLGQSSPQEGLKPRSIAGSENEWSKSQDSCVLRVPSMDQLGLSLTFE